ncbi:MAG: C-GCAxxG-C-C family protein [Muribaculaceae bacterium]|nr:C-GCAxxG-C-C family protein [Muribaculaceae bacterium]
MAEKNRIEAAREGKASGKWNCAQAVGCAFCEATGVGEETMAQVGAAFGNGMGCMEGTCGALTGAGLVLGMHYGGKRVEAMKAMRRIMAKFQARNGATICKVLKGVETGRPLRACADCVADAAEFLEEELEAGG